MSAAFAQPVEVMRRALQLAASGLGLVEPNPPVGAVVVDDRLQFISEGAHAEFGGPHAEVVALDAAGERAHGATLYVTLEPCAHVGKTSPCAPRVIASGVRKVVVCTADPAPHTAGRGLQLLRKAGMDVEIGLLADEGRRLIAPFTKLMTRGLPWVHVKWAMTLDGKLATKTGDSRWISSEESRRIVHELRGRMDVIIVGHRTAQTDDPLLTARPPGPRVATRIVLDSQAGLRLDSQLVRTARDAPLLVAVCPGAAAERCAALTAAGVEVLVLDEDGVQDLAPDEDDVRDVPLEQLLKQLGARKMTHVLVEGGSAVLGSFHDSELIDEVHAFVAPMLFGRDQALTPIECCGVERVSDATRLTNVRIMQSGVDVYVHGDVVAPPAARRRNADSDGDGIPRRNGSGRR